MSADNAEATREVWSLWERKGSECKLIILNFVVYDLILLLIYNVCVC